MGRKRNWQQVYGTLHPLAALLIPSWRHPEFLPVPLEGDTGKRRRPASAASSKPGGGLDDVSTTTTSTLPLHHVSATTSSVRRRNDAVVSLV